LRGEGREERRDDRRENHTSIEEKRFSKERKRAVMNISI